MERFYEIDTEEEDVQMLSNMAVNPEIQTLFDEIEMTDYWASYEEDLLKKEKDNIPEDPFFPNKNVPENWKWTELEECLQELENEELAREMKEMRKKDEKETNLKELADLCIRVQRIALEREKRVIEDNFRGTLSEKEGAIIKERFKSKCLEKDKETMSKILREMDKEVKSKNAEIAKLRKNLRNYETILGVWKKMSKSKDVELSMQEKYIERLEKENRELQEPVSASIKTYLEKL